MKYGIPSAFMMEVTYFSENSTKLQKSKKFYFLHIGPNLK